MIAVLLALATFVLDMLDSFTGRSLLNRPLVSCTVVGFILGDVATGVQIGAVLELAFLGLFSIGAAIPPEILSGGILGAAFAITSGGGSDTALVLAFPVAAIGLIILNFHYGLIAPLLLHKADSYAERASFRGVATMHVSLGAIKSFLLAALVGIAYWAGNDAVTRALEFIPGWVDVGLKVGTAILPALGFALLARMIVTKRVLPFLFIGFFVAAYLELPVVAIAGIGVMVAWIIVDLEARRSPGETEEASLAVDDGTTGDDTAEDRLSAAAHMNRRSDDDF